MLFNTYLKLLEGASRRLGLSCHQFVDDRLTLLPDSKEAVDTFNLVLEMIEGWIRANKVKLNPDKMEALLVC